MGGAVHRTIHGFGDIVFASAFRLDFFGFRVDQKCNSCHRDGADDGTCQGLDDRDFRRSLFVQAAAAGDDRIHYRLYKVAA